LFLLKRVVSIPSSSHCSTCCYATVFDKLVGSFDCLISFPDLIFVLWLIWLLTRLMCSVLSLVNRCNIAVTNSQVQCQPIVCILYRKLFGDNIYKQWEFGMVMVIRLGTDFGKLIKVTLKGGQKRVGGWGIRYVDCCVLWPCAC
jgi:hypothetical protein